MQEFDRLPSDLRKWLSEAVLPWRAKSVKRAYEKAMAQTGNKTLALKELDNLQNRLMTRDAEVVWGKDYPSRP